MVRVVFFALLLLNLAYFAWSHWLDVPSSQSANDITNLPRIELAEELLPERRGTANPAWNTALNNPPVCFSVGPFAAIDESAHALALLRSKGFEPRQRTEEGPPSQGYWVYVGGLKDEAEADKALVTLEHGGINDAVLMPELPDTGRRLSLGMYSERGRAERRAQTVREQTGLQAEVAERRLPSASYWIDVSSPAGSTAMPLQELSGGGASSRIAVRPCPGQPARLPPTGTATATPASPPAVTSAARAAALPPTPLR